MAGRPQKRALRKQPAPPAPDVTPRPQRGRYDRTTREHALARVPSRQTVPAFVPLSVSYAGALSAELPLRDGSDADAVQRAILAEAASRRGGRITVGEAVAAALVRRSVAPGARDGVTAAKELADRTEGTVAQKVTQSTTTFVVSLTPGGGPAAALAEPLDVRSWEAQVAGDPEASALLLAGPRRGRGETGDK